MGKSSATFRFLHSFKHKRSSTWILDDRGPPAVASFSDFHICEAAAGAAARTRPSSYNDAQAMSETIIFVFGDLWYLWLIIFVLVLILDFFYHLMCELHCGRSGSCLIFWCNGQCGRGTLLVPCFFFDEFETYSSCGCDFAWVWTLSIHILFNVYWILFIVQ